MNVQDKPLIPAINSQTVQSVFLLFPFIALYGRVACAGCMSLGCFAVVQIHLACVEATFQIFASFPSARVYAL
jgi:hypothetical protein